MLLQFSVANFRSFKGVATLSTVASLDKEHPENVIKVSKDLPVLKTAALYGANASGKSNFFAALRFMQGFVFGSSNLQITDRIAVEPFRLSTETETKPSHFEVVFLFEGIKYRYGFEADAQSIHSEWLFSYPKEKEVKHFTREKGDYYINRLKFSEGKKDLIERTRNNALFISRVAQDNGPISNKILKWFQTLNVLSGLEEQSYMNFAISKLKDQGFKEKILKFVKAADLSIEDFTTETIKLVPESLPNFLTEEARSQIALQASQNSVKINTLHKKYSLDNKFDSLVPFDLGANESAGTNKLFLLSAPILDTLENGKTLFVDEMDSRLHPLIMESIIKLFNSKDKNPNNAQLVFNAHSTLLLGNKYFRRDQIWFIQKNRYGSSEIYSLDDYSVRKDSSFDKDYLLGKYGGIPVLGEEYEPEKKQ